MVEQDSPDGQVPSFLTGSNRNLSIEVRHLVVSVKLHSRGFVDPVSGWDIGRLRTALHKSFGMSFRTPEQGQCSVLHGWLVLVPNAVSVA